MHLIYKHSTANTENQHRSPTHLVAGDITTQNDFDASAIYDFINSNGTYIKSIVNAKGFLLCYI